MSPLQWTFDVIAEAGYHDAELLVAHSPDSRDPGLVRTLAERSGLAVPVVHGPYMILLRSVLGANYIDKTLRSLELAGEVGAGIMVAHAPFRWERAARDFLRTDVQDVAATSGTTFAMENLFPVSGRAFSSVVTPGQLAAFPAVVFDTSHFAVAGVDLFEAWNVLADRVVHLHVSDNFGNGRDSHAPLGTGVLPLDAFLAHVGASGWAGTITLELDCRAYLDSRDQTVDFLRRERLKAEAMLAGVPAGELAGSLS